ncbi:hypothetical protein [Brevundimonas sp.]|uniref:hypothetical protein n=1 Tax=Brevundimonas sp. TaxID=1871086 RepID=UPI002730548B|nr:hypothetical protein [Brevundimonas sp.]MDP1914350.1 hypothetical protein [Brevundimonas sp.]
MPPSIRTICVTLCVALVAALGLHASAQAQHEVGHSSGWPPVSMVENDYDGHAHKHVAPTEKAPEAPDQDKEGQPTGHHHSSVEKPSASPPLTVGDLPTQAGVSEHSFERSRTLDDVGLDGPEYPPKRMRPVV